MLNKNSANIIWAFTLAEVLITLTIIGVIAAITIPNLMQSWRKHERITQIKSAYAIIQNATKMAIAENGNPDGWDFSGAKEYTPRYFLPYVKVQKECSMGNGSYFLSNGCFIDNDRGGIWYNLNGNLYNGNNRDSGYGSSYYYKIKLQNGMDLGIWAAAKQNQIYSMYRNIIFLVDVDGHKGPTTLGKDVFTFTFSIDSGKFLTGSTEATAISNSELDDCNINGTGLSCARMIELNHWEFPDNYPVKKF